MDGLNLTARQLATRWQMKEQSLSNWRATGQGPRFLKLGRKILYPLTEIEAFEQRAMHVANSVKAE